MVFCCRELLFSKLDRHPQQQPPPPVLRAATGDTRQSFSTIDKCFFPRIADTDVPFPCEDYVLRTGRRTHHPRKTESKRMDAWASWQGYELAKFHFNIQVYTIWCIYIYIYNVYIKHPGWRFTEHSNEASWHHYRFSFPGSAAGAAALK